MLLESLIEQGNKEDDRIAEVQRFGRRSDDGEELTEWRPEIEMEAALLRAVTQGLLSHGLRVVPCKPNFGAK